MPAETSDSSGTISRLAAVEATVREGNKYTELALKQLQSDSHQMMHQLAGLIAQNPVKMVEDYKAELREVLSDIKSEALNSVTALRQDIVHANTLLANGLEKEANEMKALAKRVESLEGKFLEIKGAEKMGKFLWAIFSALAGAGIFGFFAKVFNIPSVKGD